MSGGGEGELGGRMGEEGYGGREIEAHRENERSGEREGERE